jgi:hypothetical protein
MSISAAAPRSHASRGPGHDCLGKSGMFRRNHLECTLRGFHAAISHLTPSTTSERHTASDPGELSRWRRKVRRRADAGETPASWLRQVPLLSACLHLGGGSGRYAMGPLCSALAHHKLNSGQVSLKMFSTPVGPRGSIEDSLSARLVLLSRF